MLWSPIRFLLNAIGAISLLGTLPLTLVAAFELGISQKDTGLLLVGCAVASFGCYFLARSVLRADQRARHALWYANQQQQQYAAQQQAMAQLQQAYLQYNHSMMMHQLHQQLPWHNDPEQVMAAYLHYLAEPKIRDATWQRRRHRLFQYMEQVVQNTASGHSVQFPSVCMQDASDYIQECESLFLQGRFHPVRLDLKQMMDELLLQYLTERYGYDGSQPESNGSSKSELPNLERACLILNVQVGAPLYVAEAAYRAAMKQSHPDAGGSVEQARNLSWAIEQLRGQARTGKEHASKG